MKGKRASIIKQPVKSRHLYVYVEGGGGGRGWRRRRRRSVLCVGALTNRYNTIQDLTCIIQQNSFR